MGRNIEGRITELEQSTPRGYGTFDRDGKPVITSDLPAREWLRWATNLFNSRGRTAEKEALRQQLNRSVGTDNCGGRLYELVAALAHGPAESDKVAGDT